jgi:hypothetical protein
MPTSMTSLPAVLQGFVIANTPGLLQRLAT